MTIGRKLAFAWLVPAVLAGALCVPAAADSKAPGPDWMPQDQAVRKLADAGYTGVTRLEADGGRWEGKAIKDGRTIEVRVDPRTGVVSEEDGEDDDN